MNLFVAKGRFPRYPPVRARFTRKTPRSLRERLHKFSGLISFLGLAIVVSTFIVKDVLRDNQKDVVDSFEATRNVWLLKTSMDQLHEYSMQSKSLTLSREQIDKSSQELTTNEAGSQAELFYNSLETMGLILDDQKATYKVLYEKLPRNVRRSLAGFEKYDDDRFNTLQSRLGDVWMKFNVLQSYTDVTSREIERLI